MLTEGLSNLELKEIAEIEGRFQVIGLAAARSGCDYLESEGGAVCCHPTSCCKSKSAEKRCPAKSQR